MKFGIASYHRCDTMTTVTLLRSLGIQPDNILVATQTKNDYTNYKNRWQDDATIIFAPANNAAANRNTILKTCDIGERIILMDDDVKNLSINIEKDGYTYGTSRKLDGENFQTMIEEGFSQGSSLWGIFATHNNMFMRSQWLTYGAAKPYTLVSGAFMGITFTGDMFDESFPLCEDSELSLRLITKGDTCPKLSLYGLSRIGKEGDTPGGLYDTYHEDGLLNSTIDRVISLYPELVTRSPRKGNLRMKRLPKKTI